MQLSSTQKKLLKWVGYPLLALITFVFALHHTFPYERLQGKIVESLSDKYDVSIMSIEPKLLPGGFVLDSVMLKTRPAKEGDKISVIVFKSIEIDIGLFSAIRGNYNVDVLAEIAGGEVEGSISYSKAGIEAEVTTDGLPLQNLPGVADAVGLPMEGTLDASLELELPKLKWKDAKGAVKITCNGCTVGDGEAKLKMKPRQGKRFKRRNAFASDGVTVPRLDLGAALVEISINKGIGKIERFAANSRDGQLTINGEIRFSDPFKNSTFPGCMNFKLTEDLKQREPNFGNIEAMLPARARQEDGTYSIPTKGKLTALRWDVRRKCNEGGAVDDPSKRNRPTITSRPATDPNRPVRGGTGANDPAKSGGGGGDVAAAAGSAADAEAEKADKLRRAGDQPGNDEPETKKPGASGPALSPASVRAIKRGDDVKADEGDREPDEGGPDDRGDDDDDDDDDDSRGDDDDDDDDDDRRDEAR
jgi:type II secretion system protein N